MAKSKTDTSETDDNIVSTAADNAGAFRADAPAPPTAPPPAAAGASSLNPQVPNNPGNTVYLMATPVTPPRPVVPDAILEGVKRGDMVRLLEPHYDGFQLIPADTLVRWWNDDPPSVRYACLPEAPQTPLTAPAMTDGKPPADYVDPSTGKKPVIGSV